MKINTEFARDLIKGKIAEVIFERMLREEERYTVIPFGYEYTVPMLAQYRHYVEIPKIIDNISEAPDFVLISESKTKVYLIEVKYQNILDIRSLKQYSDELLKRWEYPWIFVATPKGFYCDLCSNISRDSRINDLSDNWVAAERREKFLELLNEFEKR